MDRNTLQEIASTPEFQALAVEALGTPERAMGESVIAAQPPNWKEVARLATDLKTQFPLHLPTLIYFTKARVNTHGFAGLNESLTQINDLLGQHWNELHPFEDTDDPDDPWYERVNLIREVSEDPAFIDALRRAPLISVRGIGTYSVRDMDITAGVVRADSDESAHCQEGLLKGALSELGTDEVTKIQQALASCVEGAQSLVDALETQNVSTAKDMVSPLSQCVSGALARFEEYASEQLLQSSAPEMEAHTTDALAAEQPTQNSVSSAEQAAAVSSFTSRTDTISSLNRIIAYYQAYEPASPVAIFAARARDLVPKNFFEVLTDLAPGNDGNLGGCLEVLHGEPLKYLLADSFQRHVSGGGHHNPELNADTPTDSSLSSREDVMKELSEIENYFRVREPASPIPLLIAEMRRLVPRSFTELLSEFSKVTAEQGSVEAEAEPS